MSSNTKKFKYGLNIVKKPQGRSRPVRKSVFEDDSDEPEESQVQPQPSKPIAHLQLNTGSQEQTDSVDVKDPTIFAYDEVYDSMKSKEKSSKAQDPKNKPKYILHLLQAAERRKLDHLRSQEKISQKQRELEGEVFNDTEVFITEGYRQQKELMQKLDEEETKQELVEKQNVSNNITDLYKTFLEQRTSGGKDNAETSTIDANDTQKSEQKDVQTTLSAGLNVFQSKTVQPTPSNSSQPPVKNRRLKTQELEEQIRKLKEEESREEEVKKQELQIKWERRNNDNTISEARARYLARKAALQNTE